jgi:hypothetical protein
MPSRKVFTNGWTFWLAKHRDYGLVLFDRADQDGVSAESIRLFDQATKSRIEVAKDALGQQTTADVSDSDSVSLVNDYNALKRFLGKPAKAPGYSPLGTLEDRHKRFLRERNMPDRGRRPAATQKRQRVTHCWSCTERLDTSIDVECAACRWIVCDCGACGCGR